jgi:hypothetical protein
LITIEKKNSFVFFRTWLRTKSKKSNNWSTTSTNKLSKNIVLHFSRFFSDYFYLFTFLWELVTWIWWRIFFDGQISFPKWTTVDISNNYYDCRFELWILKFSIYLFIIGCFILKQPLIIKLLFLFVISRVFQNQLPDSGAPLLPPRALTTRTLPQLFHDHVIDQVKSR